MADTIEFELVSPERLLISEPVEMVVVPGGDGDFGVLPQHSPLISTVRPGVIDIYNGGRIAERLFVAGGFAEVTGTRCTVLAEEAVRLTDLDRPRIEARLTSARELLTKAEGDLNRTTAEMEVAVAEAMLAAAAQQKDAGH